LLVSFSFQEPNFLLYDTVIKPLTLFRNKE
jgi:hypothetical protein